MSHLPDLVLLIEDNEDDIALMLRALRRNNVQNPVVVARDGIEALDFLFARESFADRVGQLQPKLVLLDLKLPRLDGLGVLAAIRANTRTCFLPVVILTSSLLEHDVASCYAQGANSYLVKPIDLMEFLEMVKILGRFWLTMNQSPPNSGPA